LENGSWAAGRRRSRSSSISRGRGLGGIWLRALTVSGSGALKRPCRFLITSEAPPVLADIINLRAREGGDVRLGLIHDGVDEKRQTERWLEPLWHGDTMWYESCMVISDNDGSEPYVPLLFEPENIVTVHHSRMDVQYEEGRDYALKDGRLIFPHGSGVPVVSRRELIMEEEAPGESMPGREGGYVLFHEGSYFHDRQIAVTYMHSRTGWQGPVPANQSRLLPHTARKLASGVKF